MRRWLPTLVAAATTLVIASSLTATATAAPVLREKDVNLDESLRLADVLRARGLDVVLTRTTDIDLPLAERARRGAGADLLVSVHNNGSGNPAKRGSEVYAQVNNRASRAFADRILDGLAGRAGTTRRGVFTRPGERGDYYAVLRKSPTTAVIVEGAFLSNREEARQLADAAFRQRLAEGIANGIIAGYTAETRRGPGPPPPRILLGSPGLPAPSGVTAVRTGPHSFRLSWTPVFGASGYEVWRDGNRVAGTALTEFEDTGLGRGGHQYQVRAALDAVGGRILDSQPAIIEVALGRVVVDPGHGGADPGAVGAL